MKIIKFNENKEGIILRNSPATTFPSTKIKFNQIDADSKYPFRCKYKNRIPDPGLCYVLEINFEEQTLSCSNGRFRYFPSFDEVEFIPDIFIFNKYNL